MGLEWLCWAGITALVYLIDNRVRNSNVHRDNRGGAAHTGSRRSSNTQSSTLGTQAVEGATVEELP